MSETDPEPLDEPGAVARLALFCAELYRTVPPEGVALAAQAEELAHAADLELLAATLSAGADVDLDSVLLPRDLQVACQLLLDVRRAPKTLDPAEVELVRRHFPEVEAESLDPLEQILRYYLSMLGGR